MKRTDPAKGNTDLLSEEDSARLNSLEGGEEFCSACGLAIEFVHAPGSQGYWAHSDGESYRHVTSPGGVKTSGSAYPLGIIGEPQVNLGE